MSSTKLPPRRIVFMGTPDFALPSLKALVRTGASIVGVYTQPPRAKGRGYKVQHSPVHAWALEQDFPVFTPPSLKSQEAQNELARLRPDLLIVAAYGLILPKVVLAIPPRGAINVHASLLPRWRGAAPIQRAILAGDKETGVTIMEMEAGLDTGPMLAWEAVPISLETTAVELSKTLAHLGAKLLVSALEKREKEGIISVPQPAEGVSYASKILREEGKLKWDSSVFELDCQVRALNPWPGTWFLVNGKRLKVLEAQIENSVPGLDLAVGTLVAQEEQMRIHCKDGVFYPLKVMPEGRKAMSIGEYLRGHPFPSDTYLL